MTLVKKAGPSAIGPGLKMAVYELDCDVVYPTGGFPIDVTDDFDYVFSVDATSNMDGYLMDGYSHGCSVKVTETNVKIKALSAPATEVSNGTNISQVDGLNIVIIGK